MILIFSCFFPEGYIDLAFLTSLYARGALLLTIAHLAVAVANVVVAETPHVRVYLAAVMLSSSMAWMEMISSIWLESVALMTFIQVFEVKNVAVAVFAFWPVAASVLQESVNRVKVSSVVTSAMLRVVLLAFAIEKV